MASVESIIARAHELGLNAAGISPAQPIGTERYEAWLANGYQGGMAYLARPDAVQRRADPTLILPGVRSIVTAGMNYHTLPLPPELRDDPSRGVIASYAWGNDYHDVLRPRLHELAAFIQAQLGQPVAWRGYVDTGPVLERQVAARAALGFVGKNTNLIHLHLGSWLFLGEILVSAELPPTVGQAGHGAHRQGTCGACTRCLESCPTNAFVAPYVLDARRCISYLTIELEGPIPTELRPLLGNRIFGCDICQEVCPWNRRFARQSLESSFQPGPDSIAPRMLDLIALDEEGFRRRFRHSPIKRAKRRGLLRNVAVALGNWGDPGAVPALVRALGDAEPLIRGHAAWALGRIGTTEARTALGEALAIETDSWVHEELRNASRDSRGMM